MKTSLLPLFAAVTGLAGLMISGCSKPSGASAAVSQVKAGAADVASAASDSWDQIKDYSYDRRVEFSASLRRMAGRMDDKTDELKSKLAGLPDQAARSRRSGLKEYAAARADLKANLSAMKDSTADTWADAREKVDQSWKRLRAAYDRLTSPAGS